MDPIDPRIGTVLKGKWRLDAQLGAGGMATVYAATHRNGKRVAVKVLHPELSRDQVIRERFVREGYLANKVGRGAVSVDDDDVTEDGAVFLVMELLEGETLEARRERSPGGRLPVADVVGAMDQVLAALAVAHAEGIVHRDLKPENMFLTREGAVKVLDFGIARLRERNGTEKGATTTGTMMGTPAYMPPEQARGRWREVDTRSDLWAVGATMFTLLAGRCVYDGETVPELLVQSMTQPPPLLRSVAPDVPAAVAAVVDRALLHDKAARWPDASAMQAALREMRSPASRAADEGTPPDQGVTAICDTAPFTRGEVSAAPAASARAELQTAPTLASSASQTPGPTGLSLAPQHTGAPVSSQTLASFTRSRHRAWIAPAIAAALALLALSAWLLWRGAPPSSQAPASATEAAPAGTPIVSAAAAPAAPTAAGVEPVAPARPVTVVDPPDVAPALSAPHTATGHPHPPASSRPPVVHAPASHPVSPADLFPDRR